jgi:hypothetical protein
MLIRIMAPAKAITIRSMLMGVLLLKCLRETWVAGRTTSLKRCRPGPTFNIQVARPC